MRKRLERRVEALEKKIIPKWPDFVVVTCPHRLTVDEKRPCDTCEYGKRNRICSVYVMPKPRTDNSGLLRHART